MKINTELLWRKLNNGLEVLLLLTEKKSKNKISPLASVQNKIISQESKN